MPFGTDFFVTFVDIPLCIWYLSFYCSPATKFAVIGKILFLAFDNSSYRWADYIEKYIHTEDEIASINNEEIDQGCDKISCEISL